jgi:hypothetical protein
MRVRPLPIVPCRRRLNTDPVATGSVFTFRRQVKAIARETAWVKGHRVSAGQIAGQVQGTRDVTDFIRRALNDLGE